MTQQSATTNPAVEEHQWISDVAVDTTPHSIAVSHDGARLYVTHFLTGSVSVIDAATSAVITTFTGSPGLYGIAVSLDDTSVYVANEDSGFIHQIDVADGSKRNDAGIGVTPYGLAMDLHGRLFAACPLTNAIEILDGLIMNVGRIEGVDFGVTVAASPDGARLYVSNYFSNTVSVLDAPSAGQIGSVAAAVTAKINVPANPYGIAVSPDGARLYIAHFGSGDLISIIDTASATQIGELHGGSGPVRGVAISPNGGRLYVTNYFSNSISIIGL